MARFENYLTELQEHQGMIPRPLIRPWLDEEANQIVEALCVAIETSGFIGNPIVNFGGSNQSKGNRAADHFVATVPQHLPKHCKVIAAAGAGYPDRICVLNDKGYAMELKATSNWQDGDGNRRVLTSSPTKMLALIKSGSLDNPPPHLICSVLYRQDGVVTGTRLDFLEPDSEVNIRLEASTSQKLLAEGSHRTIILP
jgi:hypothetical protein